MSAPRILTHRAFVKVIGAILKEARYRLVIAEDAGGALSLMERRLPHLVLWDIDTLSGDGLLLLAELRARWPLIPCILTTSVRDIAEAVGAIRVRTVICLLEPTPAELLRAVEQALGSDADHVTRKLIGGSRAMTKVHAAIRSASRSRRNVLITGETGTGKQLAAMAIHEGSERGERPLIEINCGAIPDDLFEAEVFGREKGAYTGAHTARTGHLERAVGSTVFLDELEAMPRGHQPKLLKVMEDGRLRRVGASDDRQISVRYFAATNEDPGQLVARGLLRNDLYSRLNEIRIDLPPLRERPEDIALLAEYFLGDCAAALTDEARDMLSAYEWPGNVRELRNVVLRAMEKASEAGGGRILREHVIESEPAILKASTTSRSRRISSPGFFKDREREMILEALRSREGNRSAAARDLGMPRATFLRKLARYSKAEHDGASGAASN
jgi:two-component system response regulator AtoC